MHGNVWQWCADSYAVKGSHLVIRDRVIRGGGWNLSGIECRAGDRRALDPTRRGSDTGFRLARVPVR
jgi:formylglycine-generating enzyme required for sulfatase activity